MREWIAVGLMLFAGTAIGADAAAERLEAYRALGAGSFSAAAGQQLWENKHGPEARQCTACHTSDLSKAGKHQRTGKHIEPMSPAVNPERLTDAKKIEKWFKRNCKWTLGRECTPQEKGDVIVYIQGEGKPN